MTTHHRLQNSRSGSKRFIGEKIWQHIFNQTTSSDIVNIYWDDTIKTTLDTNQLNNPQYTENDTLFIISYHGIYYNCKYSLSYSKDNY